MENPTDMNARFLLIPQLAGAQRSAPQNAWIATWAASPQPTAPNPNKPLLNIEDQTVRQRVRVSIGGAQICIRLSNQYGSAPLLVGSANVASPRAGTTSVVPPVLALQPGFSR
jgi:hypothetical protein